MATLRSLIDASQAPRGAAQFNQATGSMSRSARRLDSDIRGVEGSIDTTRGAVLRFRTAAVGVAAVLAGREVVQTIDQYTNLQNRLRNVTDGSEELATITQELFQIADSTRSAFEGTATIYARLAVSQDDLGRSSEELLDFTRSLNQAIILSGASAQEANAGLIQLSQGIASGALRGDELRSVLEQLPAVADVIARSLGVTRGQLRELGQDGAITADVIIDAFREASDELDERFGQTVPTVSQATEQFNNQLLRLAGEGGSAFNTFLAESIQGLADLLEAFNNLGQQDFLEDANNNLGQTQDRIQATTLRIEELQEALAADPDNIVLAQQLTNATEKLEFLTGRVQELSQAQDESTATTRSLTRAQEEATRTVEERIILLQRELELTQQGVENADDLAETFLEIEAARAQGNEALAEALQLELELEMALANETERQREAREAAEEALETKQREAEARQEVIAELDKEIALRERENELLADGVANGRERAEIERELAAAIAAGDDQLTFRNQQLLDLEDQALATEEAQRDLAAAEREATREAQAQEAALSRASSFVANQAADAFIDFASGVKSGEEALQDFARSLLEFATRLAIQRAIEQLLTAAGGGGGEAGTNAFGGILAAAFAAEQGGVVSGRQVVPFQRGGVISSPTTFPLSGQRVGVAGEAGLEGIFPLARDARGNLGVSASGGSAGRVVNVTQNITTQDASSFRRSQRQIERDTVNAVRRVD